MRDPVLLVGVELRLLRRRPQHPLPLHVLLLLPLQPPVLLGQQDLNLGLQLALHLLPPIRRLQ